MTHDMQLFCKFCGEERKIKKYGYCGKCWSQLEEIESDGDILIRLDKTLGNE